MYRKIVFTVPFILLSVFAMAQKSINDYKYIIVPKKFDFSKSEDQYQLNSLTKFLFNKHGFEAYFVGDELPEDLKKDRCLALTSEALKVKGGLFKTKIKVVLKDCFGATIMTSKTGESRLKDYDKAYNAAIRAAFETFENAEYAYTPSEKEITEAPKTEATGSKVSKVESSNAKDKLEKPKVESKVINKNQSVIEQNNKELYYAQIITDGYQIVDSAPKVVMILLTTTAKDVFIVKDKNAIVYKEDNLWIYYEHNDNKKVKKELNIKF